MEDMSLALDALLREMVISGDFQRFMRDHGWTYIGPMPSVADVEHVRFDLPFIPKVVGPDDTSRDFSQ